MKTEPTRGSKVENIRRLRSRQAHQKKTKKNPHIRLNRAQRLLLSFVEELLIISSLVRGIDSVGFRNDCRNFCKAREDCPVLTDCMLLRYDIKRKVIDKSWSTWSAFGVI